jgi:hypothetical protein
MVSLKKYCWYASYGSNISKPRFECYITGGRPTGSARKYEGCSDKTLPLSQFVFTTSRELYFAKKSKSWSNGGVGFITSSEIPDNITICKAYLIRVDQFIEIALQESSGLTRKDFDFQKCYEDGYYEMNCNSWYGLLLSLGLEEDYPIFTFTSCKTLYSEINKPDEYYLLTISTGLKELNYKNEYIVSYLESKRGIKEYFNHSDLVSLVEKGMN